MSGPSLDDVEHYAEGTAQLQYIEPRKVDILIVLDNSSSMAAEQSGLIATLDLLIDALDSYDVAADYRIAITTTDAGHPACPSSTPESGAFVLTSCSERLDEFIADGEGGSSDVRALACADSCGLQAHELDILPTTTTEEPEPRPRPWLERVDGRTNLADGVELADALRCFAPQGVAGCDFESPLEAMHQALLRTQDPTDPAYGFLRVDAALLVLIITDEDDCSTAPGAASIFAADGGKLYWSDADADAPSSAVCWNAGVACVGDPSGYDSCDPVNRDLTGNTDVADIDAVLRPVQRYVEILDAVMEPKRALDPTARPYLALAAGVDFNGNARYVDVGDSDPSFQRTFGIGPSCEAPGLDADHPIRATPPARLRALHEALAPGDIASVCGDDWLYALFGAGFFHKSGGLRPACFPECVLDTDVTTAIVEPDCIVEEHLPGFELAQRMPECARDEQGYVIEASSHDYQMPDDDVHVCHAMLTDDFGATGALSDDLSPECGRRGFNLEFKIARRPGHPGQQGSRVTATCSLSAQPSVQCPGLRD